MARGETIGAFQVWPTARPAIALESSERIKITLRIRPIAPGAGTLKLAPDAPDSLKLRRDANGDTYWLDMAIEPASQSSSQIVPLAVDLSEGRSREFRIRLTVNVPAENLVVTPGDLDFGEVTLESAKSLLKRIGVRKIVGSFHIKSASSPLSFLKIEQTTIVEGSNYLIKVSIDPARPLKTGAYKSVLVIETDGGRRLEVPVKLKLID